MHIDIHINYNHYTWHTHCRWCVIKHIWSCVLRISSCFFFVVQSITPLYVFVLNQQRFVVAAVAEDESKYWASCITVIIKALSWVITHWFLYHILSLCCRRRHLNITMNYYFLSYLAYGIIKRELRTAVNEHKTSFNDTSNCPRQVAMTEPCLPVCLCRASATTPWFENYRESFLKAMPATDHEFLNHYLACILPFSLGSLCMLLGFIAMKYL